jgi:hypothetical protein
LRIAGVVVLAVCAGAPSVRAQTRARVTADENFRIAPRGDATILARVTAGTEVRVGGTQGDWREVTLEGWIWSRSVRPSSGDLDVAVSLAGGENLRSEPNGTVVARLQSGTLLNEVTRRDGWVRVRRAAWMWGPSLAVERPAAPAARSQTPPAARPAAPPPAAVPATADPLASLDRRSVSPGASLVTRPDGDTVGRLTGRVGARLITSADGWARVLVEAWVRESDLDVPEDSALAGVTASEVRGSGSSYEGRTLRWTLQFIALQTADELRRDIPPGRSYMLARGPLPETGFVYVLLTPEQARAVAALEPLARVMVLGRVRVARSQYLGNPVLDLIEFTVERER